MNVLHEWRSFYLHGIWSRINEQDHGQQFICLRISESLMLEGVTVRRSESLSYKKKLGLKKLLHPTCRSGLQEINYHMDSPIVLLHETHILTVESISPGHVNKE